MERMRRKDAWARGLLAVLILSLPGCTTDLGKSGKGDVLLVITNITGSANQGGTTGSASSVLLSDVQFKGSVFNDNANITMTCIPKNGLASLNINDFDGVSLDSYEVHYSRADGRNTEGVDVPFSISGAMAGFVPPTSVTGTPVTSIVSIIVVRHQAKLEPPLSALAGVGQGQILTTIATITVHGHTLAGQQVDATGTLEIVFADFGDGS